MPTRHWFGTNGEIWPEDADMSIIPNTSGSLGTSDDPWFGLQVVASGNVQIIGDDGAARTITIGQSGTYDDTVEIGGVLACKESVTCEKGFVVGSQGDPQNVNIFAETIMAGNLIIDGSVSNKVQLRVSASAGQSVNVLEIADSGGAAKVVVDKDFNLGIGTATPAELLDVAGNAHIDATLTVDGAAVFNADGGSANDFQIKGDTNDNLFFADASADKIGIGTNAPEVLFHVRRGTTGTVPSVTTSDVAIIQNNALVGDNCAINIIAGTEGVAKLQFGDSGSFTQGTIELDNDTDNLTISVDGTPWFKIGPAGRVELGYLGGNPNLLIETTGSVHLGRDTGGNSLIHGSVASCSFGRDNGGNAVILTYANGGVQLGRDGSGTFILEADPAGRTVTSCGRVISRTFVDSSPFSVLVSHHYLAVDTTAARTLNLPAMPNAGQVFIIKDATGNAGTNNITITPNGLETIDGAANLVLNTNLQSATLISDGGTNWEIV